MKEHLAARKKEIIQAYAQIVIGSVIGGVFMPLLYDAMTV